MSTLRALPLVALTLVAAGCLDVAEERARYDLQIGKASAQDAAVSVEGGLASVRSFAPGELTLWGGAPTFAATLQHSGGGHTGVVEVV